MWVGGKLSPVLVHNHTKAAAGSSAALGDWTGDLFACTAGSVRINLSVKTYRSHIDVATFEVSLPDGANGTRCRLEGCLPNTTGSDYLNSGSAPPIVGFPSFTLDPSVSKLVELGKLTIAGDQIGSDSWGYGGLPPAKGRAGGPYALFEDATAEVAILSPLDHFAASVNHAGADGGATGANAWAAAAKGEEGVRVWSWGPSGEIASLPPGFTFTTALVVATAGVTEGWSRFGSILRSGLDRSSAAAARLKAQAADPNVNRLSYYTDAGTEYTSGTVASHLTRAIASADLPYGLVQLDDWAPALRDGCINGCLEKWAGSPKFFPDGGWASFSNRTGLPLALYFGATGLSVETARHVFNVSSWVGSGGDHEYAVPTPEDAPAFFHQIMRGGLAQGMGHTLEIDFLDMQYLNVPQFRGQLEAFPAYFSALGAEAERAGVAVELCMALPHHVLAAVEMATVTSMRVGMDYDWPSNCNIGVSSFLPWSVGVRPSKDAFMTSNLSTPVFAGPPFIQHGVGNPMSLPELNAVIAAFSTGPVGIGDGPNATNRAIVLPACDAGGWLLQPDKPLTAIDATFAKAGQDPRGAPSGGCKSSWMSAEDGGAIWSSVTQLSYQTPPTTPTVAADTTRESAANAANDSRPATATAIAARLPPAGGAGLYSSATYTTHFVLAINVTRPWALRRADVWPRAPTGQTYVTRVWPNRDVAAANPPPTSSAGGGVAPPAGDVLQRGVGAGVVKSCVNGSDAVASRCVTLSLPPSGLLYPSLQSFPAAADGVYAVGESPFVLLAAHQVLANGWVVWEENKYVSVARRRLHRLATSADALSVTVGGNPGEVVNLVALRPHAQHASKEWTVVTADVVVGKDAVGVVTFR
jgi:hypothetical protein